MQAKQMKNTKHLRLRKVRNESRASNQLGFVVVQVLRE